MWWSTQCLISSWNTSIFPSPTLIDNTWEAVWLQHINISDTRAFHCLPSDEPALEIVPPQLCPCFPYWDILGWSLLVPPHALCGQWNTPPGWPSGWLDYVMHSWGPFSPWEKVQALCMYVACWGYCAYCGEIVCAFVASIACQPPLEWVCTCTHPRVLLREWSQVQMMWQQSTLQCQAWVTEWVEKMEVGAFLC